MLLRPLVIKTNLLLRPLVIKITCYKDQPAIKNNLEYWYSNVLLSNPLNIKTCLHFITLFFDTKHSSSLYSCLTIKTNLLLRPVLSVLRVVVLVNIHCIKMVLYIENLAFVLNFWRRKKNVCMKVVIVWECRRNTLK